MTTVRRTNLIALAGLWLLAGLMGGCASTPARVESRKVATDKAGLRVAVTQPATEFEPIDERAYQYYIEGLLYEELRDLQGASRSFGQAFIYCPESMEIGLAYARSMAQLQNYPRAIEIINKLGGTSAESIKLKALCYRKLGDSNRAAKTYLELQGVDSTAEVAYMYLAGYYQQRQNPDSAIWALQNLARVLPDRAEVQSELGRAYVAAGRPVEARAAFRRSLELNASEDNTQTWFRLSETFPPEQPDSALAVLQVALEQNPHNVLINSEIARYWLERDSVLAALPHLRVVARQAPDDQDAQRRLGIMLMAVDSLRTADSVLTALVVDGDPDPATRFYLGRLAILEQDFERARDELEAVTERAPALPDAWLALGFSYRRLGEPNEEINSYQRGLEHMREEEAAIQLYFALGAAYEQVGQVDSAITTFEEILAHDPDHAASLNYLGYTLADRGIRLDYARELLERAVALQPNNAAFLDSYGWVFYRLGDFETAVRYLQSAAELDSDPVIYDHFGDALQARGETDRAREWWQKALEQQPDNESIREKLSR